MSTRTSPRPPARRRVLTAISIAALLGGGALAVAGMRTQRDLVVLDVETARSPVPSTVAPLVTEPETPVDTVPGGGGPQSPVHSDDPPADAGPVLSPLADLLGPSYSAVPEEIEPRP